MMEASREEDKDSTEDLWHCTFALTQGTRILLQNTEMCLLYGNKYGLLGGGRPLSCVPFPATP